MALTPENKKFLLIAAGVAVVIAVVSVVIYKNRTGPVWMKDTKKFDTSGVDREYCKKDIAWAKSALPVPVYVDSTVKGEGDNDWTPAVEEGLKAADPWGKLFAWKGTLPGGSMGEAPNGSIVLGVSDTGDEEHGRERWFLKDAGDYCQMIRSEIELPVGTLPGKGRTRLVAHELLHAMGLGHSDGEEDLMYRVASTRFPFRMGEEEKKLLEERYLK